MKRTVLLAVCFLAFATPADAQQHAPAGGTYVNGKFYAGGQFLPHSAGGFGMGGGGGGGGVNFYLGPMPAARPYRPKTTARRLARVKARTSARTTASLGRTSTAIVAPSVPSDASRPLADYAGGPSEADEAEPAAAEATESQSDAVKLAQNRIQTAKNLITIGKNAQAKEWLDLVVKMNASRETVKEAKGLLASVPK